MQGDFRFARQGTSGFQLFLARVKLCASRVEIWLGEALTVIQVRGTIKVELSFERRLRRQLLAKRPAEPCPRIQMIGCERARRHG